MRLKDFEAAHDDVEELVAGEVRVNAVFFKALQKLGIGAGHEGAEDIGLGAEVFGDL